MIGGLNLRTSSILLLAAVGATLSACGWQTRTAPSRVAVATPAAARAAAPAQTAANPTQLDPNQIVCVRRDVTGSRLASTKECHTRAEWAERKTTGEEQLELLRAAPNAGAMRANGM